MYTLYMPRINFSIMQTKFITVILEYCNYSVYEITSNNFSYTKITYAGRTYTQYPYDNKIKYKIFCKSSVLHASIFQSSIGMTNMEILYTWFCEWCFGFGSLAFRTSVFENASLFIYWNGVHPRRLTPLAAFSRRLSPVFEFLERMLYVYSRMVECT